MRTGKPTRRTAAIPKRIDRTTQTVCRISGTALSEAMKEAGVSVNQCADACDRSRTQVQHDKTKGFYIPYLRSWRIAELYLEKMLAQIRERNGRR